MHVQPQGNPHANLHGNHGTECLNRPGNTQIYEGRVLDPVAVLRPFEIFGDALAGFDDAAREQFFWRNGAEHFGLA
jgi:hypothetical protein